MSPSRDSTIRPVELHREYQALLAADVARLFAQAPEWPRRPCPLCGAQDGHSYWQRPPLQYSRCAACRVVYLDPIPPTDLLAAFFHEAPAAAFFHEHLLTQSAEQRRTQLFAPRVALLDEWVVPGAPRRVLDLGCAIGTFLDAAVAGGWEVAGVEPNAAARLVAARSGHRVSPAIGAAPLSWGPDHYGAITAWEVIAHLPEPVTTLREVVDLLGTRGTLLLTTPNVDGLEYRLLGAAHENCSFPFLQFFSPTTIRRLCAALGLQCLHCSTPGTMDVEHLRVHYGAAEREGWPPVVEQLLFSDGETDRWLRAELQAALVRAEASGHLLLIARRGQAGGISPL